MPVPSQPPSESEGQVAKMTPAGCEMIPGKVGDQNSNPQLSFLPSSRIGSYRTSPGVDCLAFKE